ncbi:hypothetical protein KAR91_12820 [Candidatus Pacearchaeota archaeon]|nr:hypothetical protein [Candidatus Pacearchaeota archaeon]
MESRRSQFKQLMNAVNRNPWGAAAAAAISYVESERTADRNEEIRKQQIGEQRRRDVQTREDFLPFLETGRGANERLNQLLLGGDISSLQDDPLIQSQLEQATQQSNRSAAATGRLGSGANAVDIFRRSGNVYGDRINQLLTLSGRGQTGVGTQAGLGQRGTENINRSLTGLIDVNNQRSQGRQNAISNAYYAYLADQNKSSNNNNKGEWL